MVAFLGFTFNELTRSILTAQLVFFAMGSAVQGLKDLRDKSSQAGFGITAVTSCFCTTVGIAD
jgi:hypothetical protein